MAYDIVSIRRIPNGQHTYGSRATVYVADVISADCEPVSFNFVRRPGMSIEWFSAAVPTFGFTVRGPETFGTKLTQNWIRAFLATV